MANEVAAHKENKAVALVEYFASKTDEFKKLLAANQVDKFMRITSNAILRDPSIAEASTKSIFLECQKAAADGLVLDGREAVLNKYVSGGRKDANGNWSGGSVNVTYIPMLRGLRKIVSQCPNIASWGTGLVYNAEYEAGDFSYTKEPPSLKHKPMLVGDPGPVVAAYSVVRLKSGEMLIDVMTRAKLDAIRARSKAPNGPWKTDTDEMYIKTVARHHFKSIPLGDKGDAFERVDGLYDLGEDVLDVEPEPARPVPASVANKKAGGAAAKLAAARPAQQAKPAPEPEPAEEVAHDADTGEILEGEIMDDAPSGFTEDEF